jgi:signal transduction histidine kinase
MDPDDEAPLVVASVGRSGAGAGVDLDAGGLVDLGDDARRIESSLGGRDAGAGPVDAAGIGREPCGTFSGLDRVEAVSCDLPDSLPVEAGPGLADALERLVRNAVERAGERPTVRVSASPAGDADRWVDVRVRDDGPGIPGTEREEIAGDREPTQLAHGTGLGLWLVRWTVEACGGEIRFEGDDDGTTVVVRLRRAAPEALDGVRGRDGADAGGESDDPGDDPATRDAGRERVD